jgi:hypothetical protein
LTEPLMAQSKKPLWTCPKCGHRFVTRNLWHSCSNYSLDDHFEGKDPVVRKVFNKLLAMIRKCGPVEVIPQKSRIAIQARVRFAGGVARKSWFDAALWLTRRAEHSCLRRVETFGPKSYGLHFRLMRPEDLDDAFAALVREAYAVGCQQHLER